MKKIILAVCAISVGLPAAAQGNGNIRMSEEQLLNLESVKDFCGPDLTPSAVTYLNEVDNSVAVTCDDAQGFVPVGAGGGLGLGGGGAGAAAAAFGLAVAAAAGGLGGGTSDTQ